MSVGSASGKVTSRIEMNPIAMNKAMKTTLDFSPHVLKNEHITSRGSQSKVLKLTKKSSDLPMLQIPQPITTININFNYNTTFNLNGNEVSKDVKNMIEIEQTSVDKLKKQEAQKESIALIP